MGRKKTPVDMTQHPKTENKIEPGFEQLDKALAGFTNAMKAELVKMHNDNDKFWNDPNYIKKVWKNRVDDIMQDCNYSGFRTSDCVDLACMFLFQFQWLKDGPTRLKKRIGGGLDGN